jgi:hypothetical protein
MAQLTVLVAPPGTPLLWDSGRSFPGHIWYQLSDSNTGFNQSYGFAPIDHGLPWGEGRIFNNDNDNYLGQSYSRTIDISDAQFEKLRSFGDDPAKYGFDNYYVGPTNGASAISAGTWSFWCMSRARLSCAPS